MSKHFFLVRLGCSAFLLGCLFVGLLFFFLACSFEDVVFSQGAFVAEEDSSPQALGSGRKNQFSLTESEPQNMVRKVDQVDEAEDFVTLSGKLESEKRKIVTPLYQRVLSALIVEDEMEEFQESRGTNMFSQYGGDDFPDVIHPSVDIEPENSIGIAFESELDLKTQQRAGRRFSCNGSTTFNLGSRRDSQSFNDQADHGYQPLNNGYFSKLHENGLVGPLGMHLKESNVSVFNCQYEQMSVENRLMLELQSIGLYPETVVCSRDLVCTLDIYFSV